VFLLFIDPNSYLNLLFESLVTTFKLNYYEITEEKEKEHLKRIIEIFLLKVFDKKKYLKNNALRSIFREVMVNKVLWPTIELICDPDYLNQQLINYLTSQQTLRSNNNKKFSHAANYEDFIRMIKTTQNIDDVKEIYADIMNEIMHATIISQFKDSKQQQSATPNKTRSFSSIFHIEQIDMDQTMRSNNSNIDQSHSPSTSSSHSSTKADMLRSRDLKTYLKVK
jgi:hypothetical protein